MLGGKNKHRPLGYTIVEVMIVLAVSGVMFLIAANFINGKQQNTAFTAGTNEMASRIQDTIEQVKSGKYSDIGLTCSFNAATSKTTASVTGSNEQGTNTNCVFLGKVLYFSYDDTSGHGSTYEVLSLAGGRLDASGSPLSTVQQAGPAVITGGLTTEQTIPQSLSVQRITVNNTVTKRFAIGFLQSPAVDSGGSLANGAEQINTYFIQGLTAGQGESGAATQIRSSTVKNARSLDICLTDGTRYADIVMGNNTNTHIAGNPLTVDVAMHGTTRPPTCA